MTSHIAELFAKHILILERSQEAMMADISALTAAVDRIEGMVNDLKAREADSAAQLEAAAKAAADEADRVTQGIVDDVTARLNSIGA